MRLADAEVLMIDCQAAGATPAYGDLLELGWGICGPAGLERGPRAFWLKPQTERPVSAVVRRLTGFDEAHLASAIEPTDAWSQLLADAPGPRAPTLIHWARFELPFLRALHGEEELPLDVVCLHAVAARLFPDLPRRNIRALAGHLGSSADLIRRAGGHVEATAFIWRALVPRLEEIGVASWSALREFAAAPPPARGKRRVFTITPERRRALPQTPGVYRFVRANGDVLYVGKASNLRRRITGHFSASDTERSLEMLTQASDVEVTRTASALEAALLECDEIKRLDPPYNLQLRVGDRRAWFATRELEDARDVPDAVHPVGPLPSPRALAGIAAIRRLALGAARTPERCADALGVPVAFAPEPALFERTFARFDPGPDVLAAARAAWPLAAEDDEDDSDEWTEERVLRGLRRSLVRGGLLVRRARWLCLLSAADVAFREATGPNESRVAIAGGSAARSLRARQREFDAARYDRLRVLSTELRRVLLEGGEVTVTVHGHRIDVAGVYRAL